MPSDVDEIGQVAKRDLADQPFKRNGFEQLGAQHIEIPRWPERGRLLWNE